MVVVGDPDRVGALLAKAPAAPGLDVWRGLPEWEEFAPQGQPESGPRGREHAAALELDPMLTEARQALSKMK